jgi:acetyl-CoA carboxylase biotin carboxyl carrier protein
MAGNRFDIQEIAHLIQLVETRGLASLVVEQGEQRVEVHGMEMPHHALHAPAALPIIHRIAPVGSVAAPIKPAAENRIKVEAPMLGIFYRSPAPDQPAFVEVGDTVEVGQVIGLIEAMKVFSEVPSEVAGVVDELITNNGQLVHPGEPLMYLRKA